MAFSEAEYQERQKLLETELAEFQNVAINYIEGLEGVSVQLQKR